MNQDYPSIEQDLRKLQGSTLGEDFLTRLEAAAEGTWTELTREELQFEAFLRQATPSRLSEDYLVRLDAVTRGTHFTIGDNIVLFPKETATDSNQGRRPTWAAAAAIALIGAASAFLVPSQSSTSKQLTSSSKPQPTASSPIGSLIPAGLNRGISELHDEGIVWKQNQQPQRLLRLIYMEKSTFKDSNNRIIELEQPRAQLILVPEETH